MSVKFIDNSDKVKKKMHDNMAKALTAIGLVVVETAIDYMYNKYGKPIYQTGDLMRSLTFEPDIQNKIVRIGSNLNYSIWVHNGTRKMAARPFLRDAITQNIKAIEKVVKEHLGAGFKVSVSFD